MSVLARYVCGYNSRLTSVAVATHMLSTKTKIYKKKKQKSAAFYLYYAGTRVYNRTM